MHEHFRYTHTICNCRLFGCVLLLNNVPFDDPTPIYLINLLWKLGLRIRLDLELHYFSIFHGE